MSESAPIPMLEILDSESAGSCRPDSDHCEVPGRWVEEPDGADTTPATHAGG